MTYGEVQVVESKELFAASELEVEVCRLPSGEEVIRFVDCTERPPVIYKWCFEDALKWLVSRNAVPAQQSSNEEAKRLLRSWLALIRNSGACDVTGLAYTTAKYVGELDEGPQRG